MRELTIEEEGSKPTNAVSLLQSPYVVHTFLIEKGQGVQRKQRFRAKLLPIGYGYCGTCIDASCAPQFAILCTSAPLGSFQVAYTVPSTPGVRPMRTG